MSPSNLFMQILSSSLPQAIARISGNEEDQHLNGVVSFYETPYGGVLILAELSGLPELPDYPESSFFGMHIHENGDCREPFDKTGMHYNPAGQPHPEHAGDLLPLLSHQGYAWSLFYDGRFTADDVIGRSVVIHADRDDFTTQPSGDSGEKIGCGTIRRMP